MVHTIWKKLISFRQDAHGIVLILTAMLMVPFLILLSVAVDVGHLLVVRNQLAAAIDAAALSVAKNPSLYTDKAKTQAQVQAFIDANFTSQNKISVSNLTTNWPDKNTVDVTATATIDTYFAVVIGYNTLSTTIHAQALAAQNYLEVVLVLDNTGSMTQKASATDNTSKIEALKTAATDLTNILFGDNATSDYVKIGVVPFTMAVNVGTTYSGASWIDNSNKSSTSMSRENIDVPVNTGLITFGDQLYTATGKKYSTLQWKGCVRQRNEPYDLQEDTPDTGSPNTLFTPFFAPDEPDGNQYDRNTKTYSEDCTSKSTFFNNYLCDTNACWKGVTDANYRADQRCATKYTSSPQAIQTSIQNGYGPNMECPDKQILRLTKVKQSVLDEISGMSANGGTVLPPGLMWGWHLLSPIGPFGDGVTYSDTKTTKAIVMVTDGKNDVGGGSNGFNKSVFSAYGYADNGNNPHLNSTDPEGVLDQKFLTLCSHIKALKDENGNPRVLLYVIGLGTDVNTNLLQQCPTDSSMYFTNTTTAQLITTFQNIALGLNKLRVSK